MLYYRLNSYAEIDDISQTQVTEKKYLDELLMIETTTSDKARGKRNVKLRHDPILDQINSRKLYDVTRVGNKTWAEIKNVAMKNPNYER